MQPNPVLRRLGLSDRDRVVIIHTDDIGMCQASIQAFADLWDFGLISSGSLMAPCPWFLEAAAYANDHPQADLGVHLTLTSEWQTYRWGPISTRDPRSGLLDEQGCFYRHTGPAVEHADPQALQAESAAQVQRALSAGVKLTHIDTHMGVSMHTPFMQGYLRLALESRLPFLFFRNDEAGWRSLGYDEKSAAFASATVRVLEEQGVPLLDRIHGMPLDQPDDQVAYAKTVLDELPAGISHFLLHPSIDTPELRALAPDWQSRVANYHAFLSKELHDHVRSTGLHVIGYRALQQLMPEAGPVLEALQQIEP